MMEIAFKSWTKKTAPTRVLIIRLQAMGDTVITLPYLQALRRQLPEGTRLDFLTRKEVDPIPRAIVLFDRVYALGGGRKSRFQLFLAVLLLPILHLNRYEAVIDLQNNSISRLVRKCIYPNAWTAFDRYSANSAGERTRCTIEALGLGLGLKLTQPDLQFLFKVPISIEPLLRSNGWDGKSKLIVLNPAGAFPTRNWELEHYADFAWLWLRYDPNCQFLIMGLNQLKPKAQYLKRALGIHLINLVGKTSVLEGFAILQQIYLMVSEDSGLMHMAWISGKPTVLLLGSTRSDWVQPQNDCCLVLSADDLECGNCMQELCPFGDNHCLARHTPQSLFEHVRNFMESLKNHLN